MVNILKVKNPIKAYSDLKNFSVGGSNRLDENSSTFQEMLKKTAQDLRANEEHTKAYAYGKGDMAAVSLEATLTATTVEAITAFTQKATSVYNDLMKMNL